MADGAQGDRLGLALSDALRDAAVPEIRSELTRRLGPEVATIDSLVDYILLLIKNNHEKGDVATDLVEFFEGDQQGTQEFTDWLWITLKRLGAASAPLPAPAPVRRVVAASSDSAPKRIASVVTAVKARLPPSAADPDAAKRRKIVLRPRDGDAAPSTAAAAPPRVIKRAAAAAPPAAAAALPAIKVVVRNEAAPAPAEPAPEPEPEPAPAPAPEPKAADGARARVIRVTPASLQPPPDAVRCSFFPNCSKGAACPFWHPRTLCRFFPRCTFGDKCLYIHPAAPCRYGARCTNPRCAYTHPPRHKPARPAAGGGDGGASASTPCRYDPKCNNISCPFAHPKRDAREAAFLASGQAEGSEAAAAAEGGKGGDGDAPPQSAQ